MKRVVIIIIILIPVVCSAQVFTPVAFDKKYHIGAGAVIGAWGTFTGNSLELTPEQSALFGVATATAAGIGKELWDVSFRLFGYKDQFNLNDVAATTLGGIVGAGLSYAALKVFKKKPLIYGYADKKEIKIGVELRF